MKVFAARSILRGASLALVALSVTGLSAGATATVPANPTVRLAKIEIPGKPLAAFDIGWVDSASGKYYLADRSNAAVDVVDIASNTLVNQIRGFVGNTGKSDTSGPDGVVTTFSNREIWAGDGDSTVKVIDLTTNSVVASISTGGKFRADEMAYDPKDNVVLAANNADEPPFATLISVATRSVLKRITFENATNGAEQPVYDSATGKFYLSVPATVANPGGEMAVIDPVSMSVVASYGLTNCGPNGAALGPGNQLLAGCGNAGRTVIIDKTNGNVLADFSDVGGSDEVWFNPGDNRYYLAESAPQNLGVIDATTLTRVEEVQTGKGAHSVAADQTTNHIFVPIGQANPDPACPTGCIAVFSTVNRDMSGKPRTF